MPPTKLTWKIQLDRARQIRWSNASLFRLQTLPDGFDLSDLDNPRKGIATITHLVWAMLEGKDRIQTPDAVAELIPFMDEEALGVIMRAINEAIEHGNRGTPEKNESAGPSHTPGTFAE
jgi:hypothetical protein